MSQDNVTKIVEAIQALTITEAFELKKALEEKFGVTAAAPVVMGVGAAVAGTAAPTEAAEEKTEFDVMLTAVPADKKIGIIRVVKDKTGLGLKEAKDLVESAPAKIREGIKKEEAEDIKKLIEAEGGSVEIK
jgi:large subunit ribosomal protein L7/L12